MKIMNVLLIAALCFCSAFLCAADRENKVVYLEEAMKPCFIAVNDSYCFIGELFAIFQYSLEDFKFIKRFGGRGEGPGEFAVILDIQPTPHHLIMSGFNRVYIYSSEGEYISVKKYKTSSDRFDMADGKFLSVGSVEENNIGYYTIDLLNGDLEREKELYRYKKTLLSSDPFNPFAPDPYFGFCGGKIIILTETDRILQFNKKGEKEGEIKLNLEKQPISDEYKKSYLDSFKKNQRRRMLYDMIKDRIEMPGYFPGVRYIRFDGDLIYIITYKQKDEKFLCLVLDSTGKELGRAWIPLPPMSSYSHPFGFHKGIYYYLKDDEEKEKWMLIQQQILKMPDSR